MKKVVAALAASIAAIGLTAGAALAGEITGNGKFTPIHSHLAASICSFSGQEDIVGSPLRTQTPHAVFDEGAVQHPQPGTPGFACSPGRPGGGE